MSNDTSEDHLGAVIWNAMCLSETNDLIKGGYLDPKLNDLPENNLEFYLL
jgi:hypothetical protein